MNLNKSNLMKNLFVLTVLMMLTACGSSTSVEEDPLDITSKFNNTNNIYESFEKAEDGTITYNAVRWGGLVGDVTLQNMPVDWTDYASVTVEFSEPTPVPTQIMLSERLKTLSKAGITSQTCYFDGQDVTSVNEVVIQASDTCTLHVKKVFLTLNEGTWESVPIWTGRCVFGNWADGFVIPAEKFASASEGDKLEIIYSTDRSDPDVSYWLLKTIYNTTDSTLEGNYNELNRWGCVSVGMESTVYRVILTANDAAKLREHGLFVNGYMNNVTQCNLLWKNYATPADTESEEYEEGAY